MLKLERTSHDHDVSITFRNKEHVFTRSFLTAFTVALIIHLGLILIFHISPLKIRWSNTPSSPIVIETDLAHHENNLVLANISPEALPNNILLTAPASLPYLPSTPIYSTHRQIEHSEKSQAIDDLFNEIEKEIYLPTFSPASRTSYLEPISILISGPLASKTLINDPSAKEHQINISELNIQRPQLLFYSVLVDEQSGRVFWHEPLQKIDNSSLETLATSMIYEMQFAPKPSAFVVAGQIELHLK